MSALLNLVSTIVVDSTDWLISAGILGGFVLLAFCSRLLLRFILNVVTRRTRTSLDDLIVRSLGLPVFLSLIALGLWLALAHLPFTPDVDEAINEGARTVATVLGALVLGRLAGTFLTWYGEEIAPRTTTDIDDKLLPILRRIGSAVIYSIAVLLILGQFGMEITPLLTGLGVGGVIAGLALQATLSNYLAGTYVISDAVIRRGCYIILDSGQEGTVESIGWRSTKLRQWEGNTIVLPNSKLAEAIVTVSKAGDESKVFKVECGVSYDSDLDKVEKVVREVAREVLVRCPEGTSSFVPLVRFKEFGDSNIVFSVVLEAVDRMSVFQLKHEFIKALHKRFNQEGIVIEYPVSKLFFANGNGGAVRALPPAQAEK